MPGARRLATKSAILGSICDYRRSAAHKSYRLKIPFAGFHSHPAGRSLVLKRISRAKVLWALRYSGHRRRLRRVETAFGAARDRERLSPIHRILRLGHVYPRVRSFTPKRLKNNAVAVAVTVLLSSLAVQNKLVARYGSQGENLTLLSRSILSLSPARPRAPALTSVSVSSHLARSPNPALLCAIHGGDAGVRVDFSRYPIFAGVSPSNFLFFIFTR